MTHHWATPKRLRTQVELFCPTLDSMVPTDHVVRQLDLVLSKVDWKDWESHYSHGTGQPPIHPKLIAGAILYGYTNRIRSSRNLEDATRNRIDFMWFLNSMTIDHSTFAGFQKRFAKEIKGLNRQIVKAALKLCNSKLAELSIDGTKIRAYSSRDGARKADYLEKLLKEVDLELDRAVKEFIEQDLLDNPELHTQEEIKKTIAQIEAKKEKLNRALEIAKNRDNTRTAKVGKDAKQVSVPVNDPDSYIQPNKEGGHAPNYTPTAAVDKTSGCIIAADVVEGNAESGSVILAVEEAKQKYDCTPQNVCTDSNLASGSDMAIMAEEDILFYAPGRTVPAKLSPAARADSSQPLPEEKLKELTTGNNKDKKLNRSAFLYDESEDCYWCPMGKKLLLYKERLHKETRAHKDEINEVQQKLYRCESCEDCSLASKCLSKSAKKRTITRDEFERYREETAMRMQTDEGKEINKSRAPTVETVFGDIKHNMQIRQFYTVGMKAVRNEWQWICASFNLKKLLKLMPAMA